MANKVQYKKIRRFDSDVHVVEFKATSTLTPILTAGDRSKRQVLSQIENDYMLSKGYKPVAKINAGFFYYTQNVTMDGLDYYDYGALYGHAAIGGGVEVIWHDDKLIIEDMSHETFMNNHYQKAHWGCSLSYRLVKDGKINTEFASRFPHAQERHPRTMVGQKADGTLVFAVVEGRNSGDLGMTATQQANVMVELGCIAAANADGGGSTEMITYQGGQKKIINYLSDGTERAIGNAIVLYADGEVDWGTGSTSTPTPAPTPVKQRHIVIDPGHGGEDPGASGNGLKEKDITLSVSLDVAKRLREHGFKVSLTRETDKNVGDASARGKLIGNLKPDYGLSIHVNSASASTATGAEIFCPMREAYAYTEAALKTEFSKLGNFRKVASRDYSTGSFYDRPISGVMFAKTYSNTDYYGVIRESWKLGVSTDIVELFFINNKADVDNYLKQHEAYVEAIVKAMCTAFSYEYEEPKKEVVTPNPEVEVWHRVVAGSYTDVKAAEAIVAKLSNDGFTGVWTQTVVVSGVKYTRVNCGSYPDKSSAEKVAASLTSKGYKGVWINSVEI